MMLKKWLAAVSLSVFGAAPSFSQVVINEIQPSTNTVELKNVGMTTEDVSSWWLCAVAGGANYDQISNLTVVSGDPVSLAPGELLVLSGRTLNESNDELALYVSNSFASAADIRDYIQWGQTNMGRSGVAETAGIWIAAEALPSLSAGQSFEYDGSGNALSDYIVRNAPSFGFENKNTCGAGVPDGAYVGLTNVNGAGMDTDLVAIPTGSNNIPIQAESNSTAMLSYWYVITDDMDNILGWVNPASVSDVSQALANAISGAPAGECHIWGWSYSGLPNPVVGEHIGTLDDDACEDVSMNFIRVVRQDPDGAYVGLTNDDGAGMDIDTIAIPTGSDNLLIQIENNSSADYLSYWYIITDVNNNILGWVNPGTSTNVPLDLANAISGAPAGTCRIWGWSYRGLPNPIVGQSIFTLDNDVEEEISENFVAVIRQDPDGGYVGLTNVNGAGMDIDTVAIPTGSSMIPIYAENNSSANYLSYWYVITDDMDNILGWVNPAMVSDVSQALANAISGAPAGTCRIWGWSYRGLPNPIIGANISTLDDEVEEDLSANHIAVIRQDPHGAYVGLTNVNGAGMDTDSSITATGSNNILIEIENNSTANYLSYWYVITDDSDNILGWVNPSTVSNVSQALANAISGAPAGECHIWGWSYRGLPNPVVGANISTLDDEVEEDLSENFVVIIRQDPDGAYVGLTSVNGAGMDIDTIAIPTGSDNIPVDIENNSTADYLSYWYVITDVNNNILGWVNPGTSSNVPQDLANAISGAPAGTCRIWGWSYRGLPNPIVGQSIFTLDNDVEEEISENFVAVIRQDPDGGYVGLTNVNGAGMDIDTVAIPTGSSMIPIYAENNSSANYLSYWYVITDDMDNILGWVNPAMVSDVSQALANAISGAPAGTCRIWGWSYRGLPNPVVGANISTLDDEVEEDLSENHIAVIRQDPDGSMVALMDGSTTITGEVGTSDLQFYVQNNSSATHLSYWYIITDNNDEILGWVNSQGEDSTWIDVSTAPVGECHIWGWSYKGLSDPVVGDNISTLNDDIEEDISTNFITVTREASSVGIIENTIDATKDLSVYPNPSSGVVHVRTESIEEVLVISVAGQVKSQQVFTAENEVSLNLETLVPGVYVLQITHTDGTVSKARLVKQ